jgi:hypothetical protein|uniref:Uncharacterized protein n=1 Tax=viral metagenome TaxID=1070528 RepID=A0A6C0LUX5_9ZZZZ
MAHSNTIKYERRDMMGMDEEYGQFVILDDSDYVYDTMELKHIKMPQLQTINEYDYMPIEPDVINYTYHDDFPNRMDDTILIAMVRYLVNIWSFFN